MPKIVKSWTAHLQNPKTTTDEMQDYLKNRFGPSKKNEDEPGPSDNWYLGRNYDRPFDESHIEIEFYEEPNQQHTLMMFEHPFDIISEDAEEWHEVSEEHFNGLFEAELP